MILRVNQLTKSFQPPGFLFHRGHPVLALQSVGFELQDGASLGIVGESGSGKTTLAKILAGHLSSDKGEATFGDNNLLSLTREKRASVVQMVFQDPAMSLNPKLLLGVQLYEANPNKAACETLMSQVGLPIDFLMRYPHQLSGGQRQRFAIARALAKSPPLLIADEPVSSLDVTIQAQLISLLNELRRDKKFSLIVISHDLAVVANLCDHVLVLKDGVAVEQGPVKSVLKNPQHAYTQRLLAATVVI